MNHKANPILGIVLILLVLISTVVVSVRAGTEHLPSSDERSALAKNLFDEDIEADLYSTVAQNNAIEIEFVGQKGGSHRAAFVQGTYAYIGEGSRLTILDIFNPEDPIVVGKSDLLPNTAINGIFVSNGFAYIANDTSGLRIIDVSDPINPFEVSSLDIPQTTIIDVYVIGNYAYIATSESLRIVDTGDPLNPFEVGYIDTGYSDNIELEVNNNVAYLSNSDDGLHMIDVSDPTNPTQIGTYCPEPSCYSRIHIKDDIAFMAEGSHLYIIDISDSNNPTLIGRTYIYTNTPRDVFVIDNIAYVSTYNRGLVVVDVSDLANPENIGWGSHEDTSGERVFASGNFAYVSKNYEGLIIVDVTDNSQPIRSGHYFTNPYSPNNVFVRENIAFLPDNWSGLQILDVSDLSQPNIIGSITESDRGYIGSLEDVYVEGNIAFIADWGDGLSIVDISDLSNPIEIGFHGLGSTTSSVVVRDDTAFVANGDNGLRIIDISNLSQPQEMGFLDTDGYAIDVFVSGNLAFVADYRSGLRIIDVSDLSNPIEIGAYDTPDKAYAVHVSGSTAFVADTSSLLALSINDPTNPTLISSYDIYASSFFVDNNLVFVPYGGIRVIDFSNLANPVEVGVYEAAYSSRIYASNNTLFLASGDSTGDSHGLNIFRYTENNENFFSGTISSIWPTSTTQPSYLMQGGIIHRHFQLIDELGFPISNATVDFSVGASTVTDSQGYFTYTINADILGSPGGIYPVTLQNVTHNEQLYPIDNQLTFNVAVIDRHYAHKWDYGSLLKTSGGINAGLIAYLAANYNGGLSFTLKETNPNTDTEDILLMNHEHTGEIGVGAGAGFAPAIKGALINVEGPGAHLVGELLLRQQASANKTFTNPYQTDREYQGLILLTSIADTVKQFPGQPLMAQIFSSIDEIIPYDEETAAFGVHESFDTGINGLELSLLLGSSDEDLKLVELNLLSASGDMTVMTGRRTSANEESIFYTADLSLQVSNLTQDVLNNQVGNYIGQSFSKVLEEVFYDSQTGQITRIELSITGPGNDDTFTNIDLNEVTIKYIIPGDQIDQDVLNAAQNLGALVVGISSTTPIELEMGDTSILEELNSLLANIDYATYEILTEDGAELNLVTEIGLDAGLKINLGGGYELRKVRCLLAEEGVILEGKSYTAATYEADNYVNQPGKTWSHLTRNSIQGLWDPIRNGVNWIWQLIAPGTNWSINHVAQRSDGTVQGGAQLNVPSNTHLYATANHNSTSVEITTPITVTATSWVPANSMTMSSSLQSPTMQPASGQGFVIGGIYDFQPYTMTLSSPASLVITYTETALGSADEEFLGIFRWNYLESNWESVSSQADTNNNLLSASVTSLGTFAIGYDEGNPEINILQPADESILENAYPLIRVLITDEGVGIDPDSVTLHLDSQLVDSTFDTSTGELVYISNQTLNNGPHTIKVTAADNSGNLTTEEYTFTIVENQTDFFIYLPIIQKYP